MAVTQTESTKIPHGSIDRRFEVKADTINVVEISDKIEVELARLLGATRRIAEETMHELVIKYFNGNVNQRLIEANKKLGLEYPYDKELPFAYISLSRPIFRHPEHGQIEIIGIYVYADDKGMTDNIYTIMRDALFNNKTDTSS